MNDSAGTFQLAPHRPLKFDDPHYVARPFAGGKDLAEAIQARARAGVTTRAVWVAGPVGSGKSTELQVAAKALQADFAVALVPLDQLLDMRSFTVDEMLGRVAGRLAWISENNLNRPVAMDLGGVLASFDYLDSTRYPKTPSYALIVNWQDLFRRVAQDVGKIKPVVLILDGLEKTPLEQARRALEEILMVRGEATLVCVVSPGLVTGPDSYRLIEDAQVFAVNPVPVQDEFNLAAKLGRKFLTDIVTRRIPKDPPAPELLESAARASGGIPRIMLQLLQDAATYAQFRGHEQLDDEDLEDAKAARTDAMTRLLEQGDVKALVDARGTNGLEIELPRKIRFLSHGLLLEYGAPLGKKRFFPHPLLEPVLKA